MILSRHLQPTPGERRDDAGICIGTNAQCPSALARRSQPSPCLTSSRGSSPWHRSSNAPARPPARVQRDARGGQVSSPRHRTRAVGPPPTRRMTACGHGARTNPTAQFDPGVLHERTRDVAPAHHRHGRPGAGHPVRRRHSTKTARTNPSRTGHARTNPTEPLPLMSSSAKAGDRRPVSVQQWIPRSSRGMTEKAIDTNEPDARRTMHERTRAVDPPSARRMTACRFAQTNPRRPITQPRRQPWMAGSRPAMTRKKCVEPTIYTNEPEPHRKCPNEPEPADRRSPNEPETTRRRLFVMAGQRAGHPVRPLRVGNTALHKRTRAPPNRHPPT